MGALNIYATDRGQRAQEVGLGLAGAELKGAVNQAEGGSQGLLLCVCIGGGG